MNLIGDSVPCTGNYWCTWDTQWNMMKESLPDGVPVPIRDQMDEAYLFAEDGVLAHYFQKIRKDLIVVLDDGRSTRRCPCLPMWKTAPQERHSWRVIR